MSANTKLGEDDIAWVNAYAKEVSDAFEGIFNGAKDQFKDGPRLIERFKVVIEGVLKNGRGKFRAVDEAYNELCTAAAILQNPKPKFTVLEYEPSLAECTKTIDFRAKTTDGANGCVGPTRGNLDTDMVYHRDRELCLRRRRG